MQFSKVEIEHLKAQMAKALEVLADHEKRLLKLEGKWSHSSEMTKAGKKAVDD